MKNLILLLLILSFVSCSKEVSKELKIKQKSLDLQVLEAYREGVESIESGDVLYAAKKFNEVEILFPQSDLAPKSALMAAYAYYTQDYYADSIVELERFIKVYPFHKDVSYAHYLMGVCFFEQIVDENDQLILKNHPA